MATYVLVHGGCHDSWCWHKVAPILRKKGHLVKTPDLPGHGNDKTPIQKVTLQLCSEKVCNVIDKCAEPVILVGHSMGGLVISHVAEQLPDRIKTLVYLAAIMLRNGESWTLEIDKALHRLNVSEDETYFTNKEEFAVETYYNDCSAEDIAMAKRHLGPEAMTMFKTPVCVSSERFGRVPRIYIETLHDQTVDPEIQKKMYRATPCLNVISLNTGHSPFLSAPEQVASCLLSLAKRVAFGN